MTAANSPHNKLKEQADRIATALKAAERGDTIAHDPGGKIAAARARDSVSFAVVMDDKIIKIEMPWSTIRETSVRGISEYIIEQMRGSKKSVH